MNQGIYADYTTGTSYTSQKTQNIRNSRQTVAASFADKAAEKSENEGSTDPVRRTRSTQKEKSWWDKRHERMKELLEEEVQMKLRKARAKKKLEQQRYHHDCLESQERLHNFLVEGERGKGTNLPSFRATGAAAAAYEDCISLFSAGMSRTHV